MYLRSVILSVLTLALLASAALPITRHAAFTVPASPSLRRTLQGCGCRAVEIASQKSYFISGDDSCHALVAALDSFREYLEVPTFTSNVDLMDKADVRSRAAASYSAVYPIVEDGFTDTDEVNTFDIVFHFDPTADELDELRRVVLDAVRPVCARAELQELTAGRHMATLLIAADNEECSSVAVTEALVKVPVIVDAQLQDSYIPFNAWSGAVLMGDATESKHNDNPILTDEDNHRWFENIGITGENSVVGIGDTGIDVDHCMFYDPANTAPYYTGSNIPDTPCNGMLDTHRKIACYHVASQASKGDDPELPHGTHVSGTVVGSPWDVNAAKATADSKTGKLTAWSLRGIAYNARVYFWDINNESGSGGLAAPGADIYFGAMYGSGVRVASSSWGGSVTGNTVAPVRVKESNTFVWNHRDFLPLFAAGNDAMTSSAGGDLLVPNQRNPFWTIADPALAKNIIAVGATRTSQDAWDVLCGSGSRDTNVASLSEYQVCSYATRTQSAQYNPEHLAVFSSRGPTLDGRAKPEIVAPGDSVFSARAYNHPAADDHQCSVNQDLLENNVDMRHFMSMMGTSMATPVASGVAVLLREWLQDSTNGYGARHGGAAFSKPSHALMKTILAHAAEPMEYSIIPASLTMINTGEAIAINRNNLPFPSHNTGYGRPSLRPTIDPPAPGHFHAWDEVHTGGCKNSGDWFKTEIVIPSSSILEEGGTKNDLRVTLGWLDHHGSNMDGRLVNDLDLIVRNPRGILHFGNHGVSNGQKYAFRMADRVNPMERVRISGEYVEAGTYDVFISCHKIAEVIDITAPGFDADSTSDSAAIDGTQPFALAITGDYDKAALEASGVQVSATGITCPNNCWGNLNRGVCQGASFCQCNEGWFGPDCSERVQWLKPNEKIYHDVTPESRLYFQMEVTSTTNVALRVTNGDYQTNLENWSGGEGIPWGSAVVDIYADWNAASGTPTFNLDATAVYSSLDSTAMTMSEFEVDETAAKFAHKTNVLTITDAKPGIWDFMVVIRDPVSTGSIEIEAAANDCDSACNAGGTCSGGTCQCYMDGWITYAQPNCEAEGVLGRSLALGLAALLAMVLVL